MTLWYSKLPVLGLIGAVLAATAPAGWADESTSTELDEFESGIDAIEVADPALKPTLLAAAIGYLAEAHGWEPASCAKTFEALSSAPSDLKLVWVAETFEACTTLCPVGSGRAESMALLANVGPADKTALLVDLCDEEGPEPVFIGPLLHLRRQMPLEGYWGFRALFVMTRERLVEHHGSDRALALWARYEALIPLVALELLPPLPTTSDGSEIGSADSDAGDEVPGTMISEPMILGAMTRRDIDKVMAKFRLAFKHCHEQEAVKDPSLVGRILVKFVIAADGSVSSAEVIATTLDNEAVETCVSNRILRILFPEVPGGGNVIVTYPLEFKMWEGPKGQPH